LAVPQCCQLGRWIPKEKDFVLDVQLLKVLLSKDESAYLVFCFMVRW
jgi:hypothetical protein